MGRVIFALNFVMEETKIKGAITSTNLHCSQGYEETIVFDHKLLVIN
jgi:hypothetical protein